MLKKFVSKEPVLKGWSGDKKYCLTDEQGNRFLLRVTPIEKYDEKIWKKLDLLADLDRDLAAGRSFYP